jgi:hypothetical protein
VEQPPLANPRDPYLDVNSRPDLAPRRFFFAWFLPMCVYLILFFGALVRSQLVQNVYFLLLLVGLSFVANIGALWMMYQAVRYEKRVGRYILLGFVPFMFVWYSLVRVPLRKEFQGNSEFIR